MSSAQGELKTSSKPDLYVPKKVAVWPPLSRVEQPRCKQYAMNGLEYDCTCCIAKQTRGRIQHYAQYKYTHI